MIKCLLDPQTNGGLLISVAAYIGRQIMTKTNAVKIGEIYKTESDAKKLLLN
jgi:selenide,water dikinase